MFQSARLKLTGWYLLIIMFISMCFSAVIYNVWSTEVERFAQMQRVRIERQFPRNSLNWSVLIDDLVVETRRRIFLFLAGVNGGILIVAGGLGYVLAGRTLQPIQRMLDDQNRFISDASHELKTPFTSLKTAFEVALRDKRLTGVQARQLIKESIDEVNKLQSLSESLLRLTQYQTPSDQTELAKIELNDVINRALRTVQFLAVKKHIVLVTRSLELQIEGNSAALTELLVILFDNAIKYSPERSTITLTLRKMGRVAVLKLQDAGIGISTKDLPHIFDRFYRADSARGKTGSGGYGLGLAIAKKIVDTHHGTITVKSIPKKGSVFTIVLPVRQPATTPVPLFG